MDEVSSHVCLNLPFKLTTRPRERLFYLVLESHDGRAPGADSEEKREPVSDIDIAVADSLRVLDLKRPIREADIREPLLGANRVLTRRSKKPPLFDQFVGHKQRWGEAPACSEIGVVVQRFAIAPGVMVTRSTSATVG
jgi:hypothetical protein